MKLYVYEHCPYCVKARMIFGITHTPVNVEYLLSDDEKTPTRFIGKKMAPILQKDNGAYLPESLDIIAYIDKQFGSEPLMPGGDERIQNLEATARKEFMYGLAMPRWVKLDPPLPEFATESARNYFIKKKTDYNY